MIRIHTKTKSARATVTRLQKALTPEAVDPVVDEVALRTLAEVIKATPKRWFGQVRRSWQIQTPMPGTRIIVNESKIMAFLEHGTANEGTGFIRPKRKKALYVPLNRRAAAGWNQSLVQQQIVRKTQRYLTPEERSRVIGTALPDKNGRTGFLLRGDYLLLKKVRGIKPRRIVAAQRVIAQKRLLKAMKAHIRKALHG